MEVAAGIYGWRDDNQVLDRKADPKDSNSTPLRKYYKAGEPDGLCQAREMFAMGYDKETVAKALGHSLGEMRMRLPEWAS